ncbi:MAG TPA: SH3 domain-containing protein [Myxococcales bacterium]|nr:SH3 domain-containing protein [Myxococcales bacterium]
MTLLLALLIAASEPPGAQLFADGNAAYLEGDVGRAVAAYEALASEGVLSPQLETNLAAAYLRQGKRGLCALHLERALFLDPGDDDARADLVEVRRGNVDKLEGELQQGGAEALAGALAPLPGGAAVLSLVLLWTAAWVLLGLRLVRGGPRWATPTAAACFALALVAALFTWAAATGLNLALQRAVVVSPEAPAREGPSEKNASRFEVHEGTTVRVEDEENGFRRVKLANGLVGWVPASSVLLVVPPGWAGTPLISGPRRAAQP